MDKSEKCASGSGTYLQAFFAFRHAFSAQPFGPWQISPIRGSKMLDHRTGYALTFSLAPWRNLLYGASMNTFKTGSKAQLK